MTSYTQTFGGTTIYPAQISYRAVALSANTTLQWPTEASVSTNPVAWIMNVTASAGSLSLTMPPATEASTGQATVFNNVGGTTFTVKDQGGNTLLTVASGLIWTLYLTVNTTTNGTWSSYQNGAGTSSASAGALAGYGIKAITTTLNQTMPVTSTAVNFTADATYRAGVWVWTGGAGVASLTAPATLGNDWFTNIKNAGTGNLVLTPLAGTIDGAATVTLTPDESAIVVTDGTNFFTVGLTPIPIPGFDYTSIAVAGTGNYTLAGTELGRISYAFTGILTGDRTIIVPATVQQYWVSNDTTGAFNLYVKTSAQTSPGVRVVPGLSRLLRCDATNVIDAASQPFHQQLPTGTGTNSVSVTIPTSPTQLIDGLLIDYRAQSANTSTVTVAVTAGTTVLSGVTLRKGGQNLSANAIIAGQAVHAVYSATIPSFEMYETQFAGDGTVALPELGFNGDRDTGFYRPAANQTALALSGTQAALYTTSGNTYPLNPAFLAAKTSDSTNVTGTGASPTVIFDSAVINVGSHYNATSGIFTAPVTGKYRLGSSVMLTLVSSVATQGQITLNTSNRVYANRFSPVAPMALSNEMSFQVGHLVDMDAGDTATVLVQIAGMAAPTVTIEGFATSTIITAFSGELVS